MSHIEVRTSPSGTLVDVGDGDVLSVFGRGGNVVAVLDDYSASLVDNDSGVAGNTVADALNTLAGAIPAIGGADTNILFNSSGSIGGSADHVFEVSGLNTLVAVQSGGVLGSVIHELRKSTGGVIQQTKYTESPNTLVINAVAASVSYQFGAVTYLNVASAILTLGGTALSVRQDGPSVTITVASGTQMIQAHVGAFLDFQSASAQTYTVPDDATLNLATGSIVYITQDSAGLLTVAALNGSVNIITAPDKGLLMTGQNAFAMLRKLRANTWLLTGEITA